MDYMRSSSEALPQSFVDESQLPVMPAISRRRYTDETFYQAELDEVFKKTWLLVAHASELEKTGSYKTITFAFAPVLIVKGKDGLLRAFLNSCRHRGSQLSKSEAGCSHVITCPLHGWTYGLDGTLIGIKNSEKLPHVKPDHYGLVQLRCELWAGLVFINFDNSAAPLIDWLTPSLSSRYTAMFESPLKVVWSRVWEVNSNWKIPAEGFREVYHFDMIHGESFAQTVDFLGTTFELYRNGHDLQNIPFLPQHRITPAGRDSDPTPSSLLRLPGIERPEFSENLRELNLFPNISLVFYSVGIHIVSFWPTAVNKARIITTWLGPDWGSGSRPAAWDAMISGFERIMVEDWANLESIQKSFSADPDRRNPNASMEVCLYHLHSEIDNVIGRARLLPSLQVPDILTPFYV